MSRPVGRIWATETPGRYVGDGHADARFLAAGPGDAAPDDLDADLYEAGPVAEAEPEPDEEAPKPAAAEAEPEAETPTITVGKAKRK